MTAWRYIWASLRHYRRVHLAVALGVAVTTAVITGALLVGDSMRGSLQGLTLKSLGRVDAVLLAEHPFREALVSEWNEAPATKDGNAALQPVILTQGVAVFRDPAGEVRRAAQLQVLGVTKEFWSLGKKVGEPPIGDGNVVALTAPIAKELGVKVGDTVLLRLPLAKSLPADSSLGEKEETSASRRMEVAAILSENDDSTLSRFSMRPNQQAPRNVFVPLATLQELLELNGRVNAAVVARTEIESGIAEDKLNAIQAALRPQLADFGLTVEDVALGKSKEHAYVWITADRLVLPPHLVQTAQELLGNDGLQPVVTYLANRMTAGGRRIPYSTVAGVDSTTSLGPVFDEAGKPISLSDDEVALNDWAAERLQVKVGDSISMTWYEPETTHGALHEAPPLKLKVRAIVPMADKDGRPTWAADPHFAPELPGVTDQATIEEWKLPFELVETIGNEDDDYWKEYRTTPKAFVSHELAAKLWSTRWGTDSVLRIPTSGGRTAESVAEALRDTLSPSAMGMTLLPVKRNALAAAAGTTPFDGLFLGFSFFLMASAVMLTVLLFRLGIEQRAREVGLLSAVGLPLKRLRRLLMMEAGLVAAVGAVLGVAAGVGYAAVMVHGLNTWWVNATAAPFMELHVTYRSLMLGFLAGLVVALVTIAWSLGRFARLPARQLLHGDAQPALDTGGVTAWTRTLLPLGCVLTALALGMVASRLDGEAQAGAFFGGGALVLLGVLLAIRGKLRETASRSPTTFSLAGLALRNARRNPNRTMLSLSMAAAASFLIVALSAFRLAPTDRGAGGFDLLATADLPVLFDLATPEGRRELGFSDEDSARLAGAEIVSFRVHDGDDASCLNLYQPTQPRVLGTPAEFFDHANFAWTSLAIPSDSRAGNPKVAFLLDRDLGTDEAGQPIVPITLDRNTATYSLKVGAGDQLQFRDGAGGEFTVQVVFAMLLNSVLQGEVLMSEAAFLRLYPEEAGRRFFLIRGGKAGLPSAELASLLETQLEDFGFDAVDARDRLAELLAVQNTYLSTFQSLGALGLLLGVVGLAVAQLRSALERRGELALMQATGFRRRRLAWMVLAENLVLLVGGLGIGCLAALVAVLPHAAMEQVGTPWKTLSLLLGIVAISGAAAAWLASRSVLRAPLLPALRGD